MLSKEQAHRPSYCNSLRRLEQVDDNIVAMNILGFWLKSRKRGRADRECGLYVLIIYIKGAIKEE